MTSPAENHAIPPAEVDVSEALVASLLAQQHPDLADLPIRKVAEGWDNVMVRIGDGLCARLPRRAVAVELLRAEQRILPLIAPALPLPIPVPVRTAVPSPAYEWPWSILPWLPGAPVGRRTLSPGSGAQLGAFLKALHACDPMLAQQSPVRGGALLARDPFVRPRLQRLKSSHPGLAKAALDRWDKALGAGMAQGSVLLHGDLHPRNVLATDDGCLSAVIDWGDVCRGDPATDLAALWLLLPSKAERAGFRAAYPADQNLLDRAAGWAVNLGSMLLETGLTSDQEQALQGQLILERLAGMHNN